VEAPRHLQVVAPGEAPPHGHARLEARRRAGQVAAGGEQVALVVQEHGEQRVVARRA
jgi:hypothetical protein